MKSYKGYYIDHVYFNSEEEIDNFLKEQAIRAYKTAIGMFIAHPDMEHSIFADEKAEFLNKQFNMSWEEIEQIELSVYKAA